jgi:hypothetical protein
LVKGYEKYDRFDEIASYSFAQKRQIMTAGTSGFEPHTHDLYRIVAPMLTEKYDGRTARDCVFFLGYLHANRLGEGAAIERKIDRRLIGWAFPKDDDIQAKVGLSKARLGKLRKILVNERLLIVKKRHYDRHPKLYYLPFYTPYPEWLSRENDELGRS